jgi:hypothetical protein
VLRGERLLEPAARDDQLPPIPPVRLNRVIEDGALLLQDRVREVAAEEPFDAIEGERGGAPDFVVTGCPTRAWFSSKPTTEDVVDPKSLFRITWTELFLEQPAMHVFVVPRSIPKHMRLCFFFSNLEK